MLSWGTILQRSPLLNPDPEPSVAWSQSLLCDHVTGHSARWLAETG